MADAERRGLTVVIPVLNEEDWLPQLLETLEAQTRPAEEILVVDAGSTDGTAGVVEGFGVRFVEGGGLPGFSRNLGAELADTEWLLFLDADVRLPPDAIETAMREMERLGVDSASCAFEPDKRGLGIRFHHWASSEYFWLTSKVGWCHSIGAFLLIKRSRHLEIGGFDASIQVAEDQDYVLRLNKVGRYAYLRRPVVEIATRRFDRQGLFTMSAKWLGIELHRLFVGEIRKDYFRYFT